MSVRVDEVRAWVTPQLRAGEKVDSQHPLYLPGLDKTYAVAVATSDSGGRSFAVDKLGHVIPTDTLKRLEADAYQRRFGRLTESLFYKQASRDLNDTIRVHIMIRGEWLNADSARHFLLSTDAAENVRSWISSNQLLQRHRINAAKNEIGNFLRDHGIVERQHLSGIPVVDADVPVWLLRSDRLNRMPSVVEIAEADIESHEELLGYAAYGSMNAPALSGGGCGTRCTGLGLNLALWEPTCDSAKNCSGIGSQNTRLNSNLPSAYNYQNSLKACTTSTSSTSPDPACEVGLGLGGVIPGWCRNAPSGASNYCVSTHITNVAHAVGLKGSYRYNGSDVFPIQQNADPLDMFSSMGSFESTFELANDRDALAGLNWIIDTRPTLFINRSANLILDAAAFAVNWAGRHQSIMFTQAAGNTVPGTGVNCSNVRNGLCVGWYQYVVWNDPATHSIADSSPSSPETTTRTGSEYKNKISGLERPHLLAPGTFTMTKAMLLARPEYVPENSNSTRLAPTGSGSSFAAPMVMSAQAQVLQFEGWGSPAATPHGNKAIILASTVDLNHDGAIGTTNTWSYQPTDAKDGAGRIDFSLIQQILVNNQYAGVQLVDSALTSCGTGCREYTLATVTVPAGKKIRVAMAWNNCSTDRVSSPFLNNDLNLRIERSKVQCGGSVESNTVLSEVEMIEALCSPYTGSSSATIKVRVANGAALNSCGSDNTEPVNVAWSFQ